MKGKRAIHWFRRDLRITDNTALNAAVKDYEQIIPVYIISPWQRHHHWTGPNRQAFLCGCLESLAKNLESIKGKLIFRRGQADEELLRLIHETKAEAVFFNRDPDPFGREMEKTVARKCREIGVETIGFKDVVLHEPDEVLTQAGEPYRVYTPYGRTWRSLEKPVPGKKAGPLHTPEGIQTDGCPTLTTWLLPETKADILEPGEKAARKRLKEAIEGPLPHYSDGRNTPHGRTTSRLGQDLRFGLISIREVYRKVMEAADQAGKASERQSFGKFVGELAWREFYMAVLTKWPHVYEDSFDPKFRGLKWEPADERFQLWCEGRTGFPIVDAGMRQLKATGFMHNRLRMITAMFLTKDLRIHWREGEKYFMQQLVDGEIASNNGGWQWSAGTGADAAPYFRIQNPWTQTKNYDPDGAYIQEWVPELAKTDPKKFLAPPEKGSIAKDYPEPMVNHAQEREKTLDWFNKHKV